MAKKSKMDRGLDSLFFDNSIDEIARSDSESGKNDEIGRASCRERV